jgi:haloalkane dehalogenase
LPESFIVTQKKSTQSPAPSTQWANEYPFESRYVSVGPHRQHYIDQGDASNETLLMVHGNPTWSFYWRNLVSDLSSQYRTIAIDHLGCGLSDKPTDYDYCLQNHIDNACALVERLDLNNVTLLAHDWGGAIGMGTLLKLRERFSRIVLFNTAAFPPPYIPFRIRVCRWPVVGQVALQGFNLFARAAVTMGTERPGGLRETTAAGLLAPYDNWKNRTAIYRFVKDIPLSPSHRTWDVLASIEAGLDSVKDMPIHLVWGMKDWCFRPECLHRLQAHWPAAEVTEFENAGHYVVEDEAQRITPIVRDFLTAHPIAR